MEFYDESIKDYFGAIIAHKLGAWKSIFFFQE